MCTAKMYHNSVLGDHIPINTWVVTLQPMHNYSGTISCHMIAFCPRTGLKIIGFMTSLARYCSVSNISNCLTRQDPWNVTLSHTRTVVRECFKGDEASQWKRPKFDPSPHQNPLTHLHKNWQAWLPPGRHPAKFCSDRCRGFCSPNTWFCCAFGVTSMFVFLVLQ